MKKNLTIAALILGLLIIAKESFSQEQVNVIETPPKYSVAIFGGFIQPVSDLNDFYKSSGTVGLSVYYDVNKEVSLGTDVSFNFLANRQEGGSSSSFLQITSGPRYYFKTRKLKSSFFLEAGIGGYMFNSGTFTINAAGDSPNPPSEVNVNLGVSGGVGGEVSLTNSIKMIFRGKYHNIFAEGGSTNFITLDGGIKFRF